MLPPCVPFESLATGVGNNRNPVSAVGGVDGTSWKDCKTWKFGQEYIKILLVPADEEVRDYLVKELNRRHSRDLRSSRCMIPGRRSAFIQCPSENSCLNCPFGREREICQRQVLSLDSLMEEGFDVAGEDNTSKKADASMELERILSCLREEDSRLLDLVYLKAAGYTSQEIADHLGISRRTYVRLEQKMRSLARNA